MSRQKVTTQSQEANSSDYETNGDGDDDDDDNEYLVERVLADKSIQTKSGLTDFYLIKWDGYPEESSTWEPRDNIQDDEILRQWEERKEQEVRGIKPTFNVAEWQAKVYHKNKQKKKKQKRKATPKKKSSQAPIAPKKQVQPKAASTNRPSSSSSSDAAFPISALAREISATSGTRATASSGGPMPSVPVPKNVFQKREQPPKKKKANLIETATDPKNTPKPFSNMHIKHKAQVQGRDMAERAPDLDAIGGLFNPANPQQMSSIRPSTLRQNSTGSRNPDLSHNSIERRVSDAVSNSREDSVASEAPEPTKPVDQPPKPRPSYRMVDGTNAICAFVYELNKCFAGDQCKYKHEDRDDLPIAPRPNEAPCAHFLSQRGCAAGSRCLWSHPEGVDRFTPIEPKTPLVKWSTRDSLRKETESTWIPPDDYVNQICFFWNRGKCTRESSCKFKHSYEGNYPIAPPPVGYRATTPESDFINSTNNPANTGPRKSVSFALDGRETQYRAGYNKVCVFWLRGRCREGTACRFNHYNSATPIQPQANYFRNNDYDHGSQYRDLRPEQVTHEIIAPLTESPITNTPGEALPKGPHAPPMKKVTFAEYKLNKTSNPRAMYGGAMLLTPSLLVAEPEKAILLIDWFQKKFKNSTPGSWKLCLPSNCRDYLLDVAVAKTQERKAFLAKHDDPEKEELAHKVGLSQSTSNVRYELFSLVDEMFPLQMEDEYQGDLELFNDCPVVFYPFPFDDADNELDLIVWFSSGFADNMLDIHKRFVIVGTTPESSAKAFRWKSVPEEPIDPDDDIEAEVLKMVANQGALKKITWEATTAWYERHKVELAKDLRHVSVYGPEAFLQKFDA